MAAAAPGLALTLARMHGRMSPAWLKHCARRGVARGGGCKGDKPH